MKNLKIFGGLMAVMFAFCMMSCGNQTKDSAKTTDSTQVADTDSVSSDSTAASVADTTVMSPLGAQD